MPCREAELSLRELHTALIAKGMHEQCLQHPEEICMRCRREDVLSMAVLNSSTIVTGDYEGRINFWNVHSGERRMTLFHTANRFETAVEQLLFLQPAQTSGWPCLLSCGGESEGLSLVRSGCCSCRRCTICDPLCYRGEVEIWSERKLLLHLQPLQTSEWACLLMSRSDMGLF